MNFTPLLAVQLLAAAVALVASYFAKRMFRSIKLYQRVKQYPGEKLARPRIKYPACFRPPWIFLDVPFVTGSILLTLHDIQTKQRLCQLP